LVAPLADPDGDSPVEAILWVDPADLAGNPAVRAELLASLDDVMAALGCAPACGGESPDPKAPDGSAVAKAARPLEPPSRTGAWPEIYARREKLLAEHRKAVAAAWDACLAEIGSPRALVREVRSGAAPVAKAADPDRKWWKDTATAAALAWLGKLYQARGWAALVAAISAAIADGMAEGEADALALAASRQGIGGFSVAAAFTAAATRLAGDPDVSRKAQETAQAIVNGAAADIGQALADGAEDGASEQDMTSAAQDAASGDQSRSLDSWLKDAIWGAIAAGVAWLCGQGGAPAEAGEPGPGEAPGQRPAGPDYFPPPGQPLMIAWITDGNPCKACQDIEAGSPYAPQDVPPIPVHPRCQCNTAPYGDIPSSFFAAYLLD
jgi:hypothetical protein